MRYKNVGDKLILIPDKKKERSAKHIFDEAGAYSKTKDSNIDKIEDFLGSEELAGTYDDRKYQAKILKEDRILRELKEKRMDEYFERRRMAALKAQLPSKEKLKLIDKQMSYLLYNCLEQDAFDYLNEIRERDNELCHKICYALFPPKDMERLDELVWRIYKHGGPKNKITRVDIIKYVRAFKGIKPTIKVDEGGGKLVDIQKRFGARKVA